MNQRVTVYERGSAGVRETGAGIQEQAPARREERQRMEAGDTRGVRLAKGLGWFSIGLGVAELAVPRRLSRWIGVPERPRLMRYLGMREIAAGVMILAQRKPIAGVWSRVAGDAMDLGLLVSALTSDEARLDRVLTAAAAVAGVGALDTRCALMLSGRARPILGYLKAGRAIHLEKSIRVNRSREDVYRFWRDFQNLPRFMKHLRSVEMRGDGRFHWVAKGPAGVRIDWDAEITDDRPNERIAWRSTENADVDNRGTVWFERGPGGRGALVRVQMEYRPPAGAAGALLAKLFGEDPEQQVSEDLRRLKQILETGEIVQSEASIRSWPSPARPSR